MYSHIIVDESEGVQSEKYKVLKRPSERGLRCRELFVCQHMCALTVEIARKNCFLGGKLAENRAEGSVPKLTLMTLSPVGIRAWAFVPQALSLHFKCMNCVKAACPPATPQGLV